MPDSGVSGKIASRVALARQTLEALLKCNGSQQIEWKSSEAQLHMSTITTTAVQKSTFSAPRSTEE